MDRDLFHLADPQFPPQWKQEAMLGCWEGLPHLHCRWEMPGFVGLYVGEESAPSQAQQAHAVSPAVLHSPSGRSCLLLSAQKERGGDKERRKRWPALDFQIGSEWL